MTLPVIFEDKDYLVINKPAGLAVHGGGNLKEPTLADWLIARYPAIKTVGDDASRPGLVHRLDKEVSGLMVIAKTQTAYENLKNQFKDRAVNKEYRALCYGQVANDTGVIDFPLKRAADGHRMAALPKGAEDLLRRPSPRNRDRGNISGFFRAKEAHTEFKVLKRFINYTLLRVKIKTGRTHQIRVHFFAAGHPLVGDPLYATVKTKAKNKKLALGRIWLVADHLSFKDLKGQKQAFSLDLPAELKAILPKF